MRYKFGYKVTILKCKRLSTCEIVDVIKATSTKDRKAINSKLIIAIKSKLVIFSEMFRKGFSSRS